MNEKPISFAQQFIPMIMDGRKTQTRRPIKGIPGGTIRFDVVHRKTHSWAKAMAEDDWVNKEFRCPYGKRGDRLWVKEELWNDDGDWNYYSDESLVESDTPKAWRLKYCGHGSIPASRMPKWASRLTLEIKSVRVERVTDMSLMDARAEGFSRLAYLEFRKYWNTIYKEKGYGWETNCWVWVMEFEKIENE